MSWKTFLSAGFLSLLKLDLGWLSPANFQSGYGFLTSSASQFTNMDTQKSFKETRTKKKTKTTSLFQVKYLQFLENPHFLM